MRAVGQPKVKFGIEALAGHRVISRAARVIDCQDDFGHRRAGHGFHHLGARADDAFALRLHAHHESGDILEINQRHCCCRCAFSTK